jgi:predicted Zn-dependent protease
VLSGSLPQSNSSARDYPKAREAANQATELDADFPWSQALLGQALLLQGKPREAIAYFEKTLRQTDWPVSHGYLGCAYAAAGDRAREEAALKNLSDLATRQYVSPIWRAWIWVYLNEKDRALAEFDRALAERDILCLFMKAGPLLDSLRGEPRFQALLKKLGFPE